MPRTGRPAIDISGMEFGYFKIKSRDPLSTGSREARWICECICGTELIKTGSLLRSGGIKHCGCIPDPFNDLSGKTIGMWKVINPSVRLLNEKIKFDCVCSCGNTARVLAESLSSGCSVSCGCWQSTVVSIPDEEAGLNKAISIYKTSAIKRNYSFNLSREDLHSLFSGNCYYCGIYPDNEIKTKKKNGKSFIYSGIDRVNNKIGYEKGNVVSCCKTCNIAKRSMSKEEFISWIKRAHNHIQDNKIQ